MENRSRQGPIVSVSPAHGSGEIDDDQACQIGGVAHMEFSAENQSGLAKTLVQLLPGRDSHPAHVVGCKTEDLRNQI